MRARSSALARDRRAQPSIRHVPALDGLRGLAVLAVLLFHGGSLTGGWLGVDLFFVLSGYLITSLLLVEHARTDRIALVAFWGRRARRLLPALVVVLVGVALYAQLELGPADDAVARRDGLASLFFVANWNDIAQGASYWDRGLAPSLLAHTWSLAVEEQMYVVWPVLVGLVLGGAARRGADAAARADRVLRLAAVVAAGSAALALALPLLGTSNERVYLGTDTRAVAVALGAMVAAWRRRGGGAGSWSEASVRRLETAGLVAMAALAVAWWGLDGTWELTYRGGLLAASLLAAVVVAAAADRRAVRLARPLSWKPLCAVGTISYGLYLWHWPIYVVLSEQRTGLGGLALLAVRLLVAFAVAAASYALVELPIRDRRPPGWWEGRRGLVAALVGVALAAGCLAVATRGAIATPEAGSATGVERSDGALAGAPKVLVLGDSVAASLAEPIIEDPAAFGADAVRSTVEGCQVVWDGEHRVRGKEGEITQPEACPPDVAALVEAEGPDVVVVHYGGWLAADLEVDGQWTSSCDPAYEAQFRRRFQQVLDDAGSTGAPVVVVTAARSTNTFRLDDDEERTACANALAAELVAATPGASLVDLDAWLCPDGTCQERLEGLFVRSDGVHFQGPGGKLVAQWVLTEAAEAAGVELARDGGRTVDDDPTVAACRAFVGIRSVTDALSSGDFDPSLRAGLVEGLDAFAPDRLAELDPALADELAPLGTDDVRTEMLALFDALVAGDVGGASALSPEVRAKVDSAMGRLHQLC